jgi:outer membrane protein W
MNRFNNLFPTDETIDIVKEYIRTNVIPPDIHSQYHFRQKYKHFKLNNDDE